MRFLVTPLAPAEGVVLPHLAVAEALRKRGHAVAFYGPQWALARAERAGLTPFLPPIAAEYDRFLHSKPGEGGQVLTQMAAAVAPDLLRLLERERIDRVVADGMVHLGAAFAAEKAGVPWVSLAHNPPMHSPLMAKSSLARVPLNPLREQLGLPPTSLDALSASVSPRLHLLAWTPEFDAGPPPP